MDMLEYGAVGGEEDAGYKDGVLQWTPQSWEAAGFDLHEHWGPKLEAFRVELGKVKIQSLVSTKEKGVWVVHFSDSTILTMEEEWIASSGYALWTAALAKAQAAQAKYKAQTQESQEESKAQAMDASEAQESKEEDNPEVLRLRSLLQAEREQHQRQLDEAAQRVQKTQADLERRLKEAEAVKQKVEQEKEHRQSQVLKAVHDQLTQLKQERDKLQHQLSTRSAAPKRKWGAGHRSARQGAE